LEKLSFPFAAVVVLVVVVAAFAALSSSVFYSPLLGSGFIFQMK